MNVKLRIQSCKMIEQIEKHPEYAKLLGLESTSVFYGEREIIRIKSKGGTS